MKIRQVGAELFHADGWTGGRTDMTTVIVAYESVFVDSTKSSVEPSSFHLRDEVNNML
jgi:hypothetical protein